MAIQSSEGQAHADTLAYACGPEGLGYWHTDINMFSGASSPY